MTTTLSPPGSVPGRRLPARIAGILLAPRATYAEIAARPRWLGVLALVVLVGATGAYLFLSTDAGKTALLDQLVRTVESFGFRIADATYDRLQARVGDSRYIGASFEAVSLVLAATAIAGAVIGVFNAGLGANATFTQVFAVVAHSAVIVALWQLFNLPLAYARETMSSATNLAVFVPFLDETSFAARVLGAVDLFLVWWIVSLAIGLGVLYRRRTAPIATTLLAIYVAIGIVIAAIKTVASGA